MSFTVKATIAVVHLMMLQQCVMASSLVLWDKTASQLQEDNAENFASQVCYEGLGCFSTGGNFYDRWTRPIQLVPQSPARINAAFYLYTRKNIVQSQRILYNLPDSVRNSNFNSRKPTKLITHGFLEDTKVSWMHDMKKAILLQGDYNVILIDWSKGNQLPYTQATANTRVVGAVTGQLIKWLEDNFSAKRADFHILGHSLGSHIAGYAGEFLGGKLGRITGMDPAGPYFENTHPEVRLDPTDAVFVDAIHTDGDSILSAIKLEGGLGMMQSVGHVDFYPNGGKAQPSCDTNPIINIIINGIIEGTKWVFACDHLRVMPLVTSTFLNAHGDYKAVPCASYELFKAGRCSSCGSSGCASMGANAINWRNNGRKNVKMFLDTTGRAPFEMNHYVVTFIVSGVSSSQKQYGDIHLELQSTGGVTKQLAVVEKEHIDPGQIIRVMLTNTQRVFDINRIRISWRNRSVFPSSNNRLYVNRVQVFEAFKEKTSLYCGKDTSIDSGRTLWLSKASRC